MHVVAHDRPSSEQRISAFLARGALVAPNNQEGLGLALRSENIENVSSIESHTRCTSRLVIASVKRLGLRRIVGIPTNCEISARTGTVLVTLELSVLLHVCTAWLRGGWGCEREGSFLLVTVL